MGSYQNKKDKEYLYKNKPHILIVWFDPNHKAEENKKHYYYIQRNVFPPILRKYPGLEIVFIGHSKIDNFKREMLENKNLISLIVISSGNLKKECIQNFQDFEKLEGIIIFCSNAVMHQDAFQMKGKQFFSLCVIKRTDEFYYEINKIILRVDKKIERNIDLTQTLGSTLTEKNSVFLDKDPTDFIENNEEKMTLENVPNKLDDICDEEGYNFNIYSQLKKRNEIDPDLMNNLNQYIDALKIDFNPEENLNLFKQKILEEFSDRENFSCNSDYLEKVYLSPIRSTTSIKEIAKKLLFLYTTHYKNLLFYDVINRNLRNFTRSKIKKLRHIIFGLLLNYNQKYSTLKNYKYVHRFTNIENPSKIREGDILFCNQFLSCTLNTDLSKNKFYKDRNTIFIIKLNYYENLNFFFNYISLDDHSRYLVEEEILFCPFTKFKVKKRVTLENGKTEIHLKQLLSNSLIKLIYDYTFKISKDFSFNEEDKRNIYHSNIVYFESYLKTLISSRPNKNKKEFFIQLGNIYQTLGSLYYKTSDYEKSLTNLELAVKIRKESNNGYDLSVSESYNSIGDVLVKQSKYKQAIENYTNSLINIIQLEGKENIYVAVCYNNLAIVYKHLSDYKKALSYYENALKIVNQNKIEDQQFTATLFNNIANIYRIQCNNVKALAFYQSAEKIILATRGSDSEQASIIYSNIGYIYKELSNYKEALRKLNKAVQIISTQIGEKTQSLSVCYDYLGSIYMSLGDIEKAHEYYKQALDISLKISGENNDYTAQCYNNLGNILLSKSCYKEAEENFIKAKNIIETNNDTLENNLNLVSITNNLGSTYLAQGKLLHALTVFTENLSMVKLFNNIETSTLATIYSLIGSVYMKKKEFYIAIDYYEKALKIREKIFEKENLSILQSHKEIGDALLHNLNRTSTNHNYIEEERATISQRNVSIPESGCNFHTYTNTQFSLSDDEYFNKSNDINTNDNSIFPDKKSVKYNIDLETIYRHYKKAYEISKKIFEDETNIHSANCFYNLATILKLKGQKDLSLNYYNRSLSIKITLFGNNKLEIGLGLISIANCYDYYQMFHEAIDYYKKGISIFVNYNGEEAAIDHYIKYIICLEKNKQFDDAKELTEKILEIATKSINKKLINYVKKKLYLDNKEISISIRRINEIK